jgi:hypothetical protein
MSTGLHKDLALAERHAPYSFEYADATTRESATGLIDKDVGKFARQLDDNSLWMLIQYDPTPIWKNVTGLDEILISPYYGIQMLSDGLAMKIDGSDPGTPLAFSAPSGALKFLYDNQTLELDAAFNLEVAPHRVPYQGQLLIPDQLSEPTHGIRQAIVLRMLDQPTIGDTIVLYPHGGGSPRYYMAGTGPNRGAWDVYPTSYIPGDIVTDNGNTWIAVRSSVSNEPYLNTPYYWILLSDAIIYTIGTTVWDTMNNLATTVNNDHAVGAFWARATKRLLDSDGVIVFSQTFPPGADYPGIYGTWTTQVDCEIMDFGLSAPYYQRPDYSQCRTRIWGAPTFSTLPTDPAMNFGTGRDPSLCNDGDLWFIQETHEVWFYDKLNSIFKPLCNISVDTDGNTKFEISGDLTFKPGSNGNGRLKFSCGNFVKDEDALYSQVVFRGSTPGEDPGETVILQYGPNLDHSFYGSDDFGYSITIECVATNDAWQASFRQMFLLSQGTGILTLVASGIQEKLASIAAASWTLTLSIDPSDPTHVLISFNTGVTTVKTNIVGILRIVQTGGPS